MSKMGADRGVPDGTPLFFICVIAGRGKCFVAAALFYPILVSMDNSGIRYICCPSMR